MLIELDPVDRITADAIGPPGERAFYIQARRGTHLVTILVEKEQVQLLAASVVEILSRVGKETGQGLPEEEMGLEEPVEPEWRAGRLSIGYQQERDLVLLEAEEVVPDPEEPEEQDEDQEHGEPVGLEERRTTETVEAMERQFEAESPDPEALEGLTELERAMAEAAGDRRMADEPAPEAPRRVRFWATREQMLSLARHGAAVCARGRPRCRLCGNPIDPEGHLCPALNGHGGRTDR